MSLLKNIKSPHFFIILYIVLGFLFGALGKVFFIYNLGFYSYSLVFRGVCLFFFLTAMFIHARQKLFSDILPLVIVFCIPLIHRVFLSETDCESLFDLRSEIVFLFKYISLFVTIWVINFYWDKTYVKYIYGIYAVNILFVFLGAATGLEVLRTYSWSFRPGYNGFIVSGNESTFFNHIGVVFFYYLIAYKSFNKWAVTGFVLFVLALALSGTKSSILIITLFGLHYIYKNRDFKVVIICGMLVAIAVSVSIYFEASRDMIVYYFESAQTKGVLNMLSSDRLTMLKERLPSQVAQWKGINYLFGKPIVQSGRQVEMDLFDLFLFFGLIGSVFYFWLIKKYLSIYLKDGYLLFSLLTMLLVSFLSGHYMYSPINFVYFAIVLKYIYTDKNKA